MVHFLFEGKLIKQGFSPVVGIDEAGRGTLAGPVFAAAVILPQKFRIDGLDDSKKLSPFKREKLYKIIKDQALCFAVSYVGEKQIDKINILNASLLAMKKALLKLSVSPKFVLVDGNKKIPGIEIPQRCVIGGDGISASIAAASVLAKVERDRYMIRLHKKFPDYGFDAHKGYGTKAHIKAIYEFGPHNCHRMTFEPVRSCRANKSVLEY